jgi:hypothetical protein
METSSLGEAEQKWLVAVMLAGAIFYMSIALALVVPIINFNNALERM